MCSYDDMVATQIVKRNTDKYLGETLVYTLLQHGGAGTCKRSPMACMRHHVSYNDVRRMPHGQHVHSTVTFSSESASRHN